MHNHEGPFARIVGRKEWKRGSPDTQRKLRARFGEQADKRNSRSGVGSELYATQQFRRQLTALVDQYHITHIADIPCGDCHFMGEWLADEGKKRGIHYLGGDVVEALVTENNHTHADNEQVEFRRIDLVKDPIPKADLLIVKDLMIHLPFQSIKTILDKIRASDVKYVLLTTHNTRELDLPDRHAERVNKDIPAGEFRLVDFDQAPFMQKGEPLEIIEEEGANNLFVLSRNALYRRADIPDVDMTKVVDAPNKGRER